MPEKDKGTMTNEEVRVFALRALVGVLNSPHEPACDRVAAAATILKELAERPIANGQMPKLDAE